MRLFADYFQLWVNTQEHDGALCLKLVLILIMYRFDLASRLRTWRSRCFVRHECVWRLGEFGKGQGRYLEASVCHSHVCWKQKRDKSEKTRALPGDKKHPKRIVLFLPPLLQTRPTACATPPSTPVPQCVEWGDGGGDSSITGDHGWANNIKP